MTCGGRAVAAANVVIGMEEVFDARMASGGRVLSAVVKIASFTEGVFDHGLDHQLGP